MDISIIVVVVVGIIGFVFPILASVAAFQKGRIGWGIATIATTFLGWGWLVGMIAFVLPAKFSKVKSEVKCPACGSMKSASYNGLVDKKTESLTPSLVEAIVWALYALFFIGGILWVAILIWEGGDTGIVQWQFGSILAGLALFAFGFSFGLMGVVKVLAYIGADQVRTPIYKCNGCGKQWYQLQNKDVIWISGEPNQKSLINNVKNEIPDHSQFTVGETISENNNSLGISVYKRFTDLPSNTKIVDGQNIENDSVSIEVQLIDPQSVGTLYIFHCPWCNRSYSAKDRGKNLILNCLKCGKQMMIRTD